MAIAEIHKVLRETSQPEIKKILKKLHVDFVPASTTPKYHQLCEILKKRILDGTLRANDQLPTSGSIASLLGVTRFTVDQAIRKLVNEKFVERIQGKGTYVRMTTPQINSHEVVGVIAPTRGHLWDHFSRGLVNGLAQHDLYCIMTDFSLEHGDLPPSKKLFWKIRKIINSDPAHLVIDSKARFPFELLKDFRGQLIFINCFESDMDFEANYILADYQAGGRLVGDHLLSLGHTDIAFMVPRMEPRHKGNLAIFTGLKDSFRERNISEENIRVAEIENEQFLWQLLKSSDRPTAVFAHSDYKATMVYQMAEKLGLRIPDDLSVVGYFDTPWCHQVQPSLTSVCINEMDIAQAVLDALDSGERQSSIMIKPTLKIRDSSGENSRKK
jgi:GntR family transcriptional regulator of arabinose operon